MILSNFTNIKPNKKADKTAPNPSIKNSFLGLSVKLFNNRLIIKKKE